MRALTWNLFHGRDAPPNRALHSWRSRLLRLTERDRTHAQVNRPLFEEFAEVLASDPWQVVLLQELPPRWLAGLAERCRAEAASVLTSRNSLGRLRGMLADLNPDLIASNEGGANAILVRPPWRVTDRRELTLARRPERRRLLWTRLRSGDAELTVGNVHLGTARTAAAGEALAAAGASVGWARDAPLVFGGDLNLRPSDSPELFRVLRDRYALGPPTPGRAIDHLLVRGLDVLDGPAVMPASWRERPDRAAAPDGSPRLVRLSDHDAVSATVSLEVRTGPQSE